MKNQIQQLTSAADNALRLLDQIAKLEPFEFSPVARELVRDASAPLRNALRDLTIQPQAWTDPALLRSAVRTLNDQHRRTSAGFYGLGSRFFRARARAGVLEVFDFETWTVVPQEKAQFHDHNGRDIPLS